MPKRVTIQPHLQLEELETRYRQTSDPVERSRYHIIWLLAKGKDTSLVAEVTGYSAETEAKKRASGSRTGSTLAKLFVVTTNKALLDWQTIVISIQGASRFYQTYSKPCCGKCFAALRLMEDYGMVEKSQIGWVS